MKPGSRTPFRLAALLLAAGEASGCGGAPAPRGENGAASRPAPRDEDERLRAILREYETIVLGRASAAIAGGNRKAEGNRWIVTVAVDRVLRGDPASPLAFAFPVHSPSRDFFMDSERGGTCVLALRKGPVGKLEHKVVFPIPVTRGDLERLDQALKAVPPTRS